MVWGKGDNMRLRNQKMKYNLQIFAEGGSNGADGGNGAEPGAEGGESTQVQATLSFDDFLKDSKNQSEFDKRVAKALDTAKGKWQVEYDAKLKEAKTEAEKLAKMNTEQKAKYEQDKFIADIKAREEKLNQREMKLEAGSELNKRGMSSEFLQFLDYKDAESCNNSIAALEALYKKELQAGIEKAVNERLRGNGAPKGNQGTKVDSYTEALRKSAGL
mgnify:CR=1 FL=1